MPRAPSTSKDLLKSDVMVPSKWDDKEESESELAVELSEGGENQEDTDPATFPSSNGQVL